MKAIIFLISFTIICLISFSQKVISPREKVVTSGQIISSSDQNIILYENTGFGGTAKTLIIGQYRLRDFNGITSSIKVPAGMVAMIYEYGNENTGYGISVDLMEDASDLSVYQLNDKVAYITVFNAKKDGYVWARNAMVNGQFVPGHWERERATPLPPNTVAVVSPPIPAPVSTAPSVLVVNGPTTTISTLGIQSLEGKMLWEIAMNDQMGVIGNDYRGREEIGSACFERASNNIAIPDFINFWYPQIGARDHRGYFKKTLAGNVVHAHQANIAGTYEDFDVNIDIIPSPKYMYLLNDAHPREYTNIMKLQYEAHQGGKASCDDEESIAESKFIETEITEDGGHSFRPAKLTELASNRINLPICVYGVWIYDRGHCCHAEIHPAEQVWWSEQQSNGKKYNLNVLCDASGRFWWRKQMDDGTKLKPWGAPPVKGVFAIAFEYALPKTDIATGYGTKQFEVTNIKDYNVIVFPNTDQTYNLVYQGKNIVSFIPHNDAFKVSFEHVGVVTGTPGLQGTPDKIRGFLVIETSVGKTTQLGTSIQVLDAQNNLKTITLLANSTPEQVNQLYEDKFFRKEEGHYLFSIMETDLNKGRSALDRKVIRSGQ